MAQINITVRHIEIPEKLKNLAITKIDKLNRFFDHINRIDVIFNFDSKFYKAEMIIMGPHRLTLVAHASASDSLSAIETVVDKMERQLTKLKGKLRSHHTKGVQSAIAKLSEGFIKGRDDNSYIEAL